MLNYPLKLDWKASLSLETNGTGKCSFSQGDLKKTKPAYSSNQGKGFVTNANLIIYIQMPYLHLTLLRRRYSWKPVCTCWLQRKNNHPQNGFRGSCFSGLCAGKSLSNCLFLSTSGKKWYKYWYLNAHKE